MLEVFQSHIIFKAISPKTTSTFKAAYVNPSTVTNYTLMQL